MENKRYPEHLVFGLDIGTRSIVGTVGYRENNQNFIVVAQCVREHETRAMMDGQIHDILKVSETILEVKKELEAQIGRKLTDVCIAAAGRVLKTVTVSAEYEFPSETTLNEEHIHSLELIGVEKAYDTLREEVKDDKINFYCVGYSVIRYFLNGYSMVKLEGHKASKIGTELLATFLPDEVIDGLYTAVERAGLQVANLTLEPIAAINVAIPEKFRLLNIAMIDVGAGTSDISITKDGSIIAYGMIPFAGDEITDAIVQNYLVEFKTAEVMKLACLRKKKVTYKDIMGISHKVTTEEIIDTVSEAVHKITKCVAEKIIELNGGKSVSAVFVVGGGGKIPGFVTSLAEYLNLPKDRVALRGEEVLGDVTFLQENIKKDPLLVTPIGICLNFYDQTNNFIFVNVNGERVKLYDNNKLTIVDAAIQVGFPNEKLFPRRGKAINFTLNGNKRLVRGELGEAAVVKLNGELVGISHSIVQNDKIEIIESTVGEDAVYEVRQLSEYNGTISFICNGQSILCPKFVMANGKLVSEFYNIEDQDEIQILNYYTLQQILEFMDIETKGTIYVNNMPAKMDEKVYENFTIQCELKEDQSEEIFDAMGEMPDQYEESEYEDLNSKTEVSAAAVKNNETENSKKVGNDPKTDLYVIINQEPVKLSNKSKYIFVDIFDFYPFDLKKIGGSELVVNLNGEKADFTSPLKERDVIELYWKE
ncbi:cell division FtsA domain-containing protein [Anaerocolumna sp. MB42-C2]|uniref:cell division FtsA domain-containing protein n=1 Tax=Anaerocolumna sp. MB42-C2 TaxID=3070997 RepID=UPI0027E1570E|nr:cell division FtsA domain-containing protein [Anaerocolumna sp. MB42-C2]WMJ88410.1 cell division FtsA domain-containing protein [Anaerocolumna sp. MB42-C2]